jgi:hypothetical protein
MTPLAIVAVLCGVVAAVGATAASCDHARRAIRPLLEDGEPTRAAIEATRPFAARTRVRLFARHSTLAVAWLAVALYGLWLAAAGSVAG